jgi:hypothetical protein
MGLWEVKAWIMRDLRDGSVGKLELDILGDQGDANVAKWHMELGKVGDGRLGLKELGVCGRRQMVVR